MEKCLVRGGGSSCVRFYKSCRKLNGRKKKSRERHNSWQKKKDFVNVQPEFAVQVQNHAVEHARHARELFHQNKPHQAISFARKALELYKNHENNKAIVLDMKYNLCVYLIEAAKVDDIDIAEEDMTMIKTCAQQHEDIFGESHPNTLEIQQLYSECLVKLNFSDLQTILYVENCLAKHRKVFGLLHANTIFVEHCLCCLLYNNPICKDAAILQLHHCIRSYSQIGQYGSKNALSLRSKIIRFLYEKGQIEDAIQIGEICLTQCRTLLGDDHQNTATTLLNLGRCYASKKDFIHSIPYFYECLKILRKVFGNENPKTFECWHDLTIYLRYCGDENKAVMESFAYLNAYFQATGYLNIKGLAYQRQLAKYFNDIGKPHEAIQIAFSCQRKYSMRNDGNIEVKCIEDDIILYKTKINLGL